MSGIAFQPSTDASGFELNLRRAQFADRISERDFQRELMQTNWRIFAAVALFIVFIDATSFGIDWYRRNLEFSLGWVVGARVVAILAGLILVGVSKWGHQREWYGKAVEVYAVVILAITLMMLFQHSDYGLIAPVTLVCVVFSLYLLMPFPWWRQTTYAVLYSFIGVWAMTHQSDYALDYARLMQWLVFAHAVGLLISWQRHVSQRRLYAQRINMTWRNAVETQARVHHQALVDLLTHELRNPLASITTQAELIQRFGDGRTRQQAQHILDASGRIRQMLNEWVEGDRLTNGRLSMDGNGLILREDEQMQLLEQAVTRVQKMHPRLVVRTDLRFGLRAVLCDGRIYALVLLNLLDNAAKYGARSAADDIKVCISVRHARSRLWVRIRDWGQGIPYNLQTEVFEKHRRLNDGQAATGEGMGVGLHLCRRLLSLHAGHLRLQSKPGLGSAFVMDIESH